MKRKPGGRTMGFSIAAQNARVLAAGLGLSESLAVSAFVAIPVNEALRCRRQVLGWTEIAAPFWTRGAEPDGSPDGKPAAAKSAPAASPPAPPPSLSFLLDGASRILARRRQISGKTRLTPTDGKP